MSEFKNMKIAITEDQPLKLVCDLIKLRNKVKAESKEG